MKSVQFLKTFRPSSTPFNDFASPGLSNINVHSFLIKSHFNTPNLVYQKETKDEKSKTEFIQEGKGPEIPEIVKLNPIKIKRTLLDKIEESSDNNKQTIEKKEKK